MVILSLEMHWFLIYILMLQDKKVFFFSFCSAEKKFKIQNSEFLQNAVIVSQGMMHSDCSVYMTQYLTQY